VLFLLPIYWSVPADRVMTQQINFTKSMAIVGGLLVVARGSGRYGLDKS
jgi:uncharacterized membrane protein YphA (DoxX/SURF4 family)